MRVGTRQARGSGVGSIRDGSGGPSGSPVRALPLLVAGALFLGALGLHAASGPAAEVTYRELAPILATRCTVCHSGVVAPLGLHLDSLDGLLGGGENGSVVKAGDPAGSELIRRLKGLRTPRMPMTGPPFLSDQEIALFERWVAAGMPKGEGGSIAEAPVGSPAPPAPGGAVTYAQVAPIFATRCARCHTDAGRMGPAPEGYRLTTYAGTLSAADYLRVVPGHPETSELVRRIRGQARPRMPHDGPPYLGAEQIRLIEDWIAQGAKDTAGTPSVVPTGARLRLHGTLEPGWRLDGLPLHTASARLDRRPRPGDYVEVRGRLEPDGSVRAERIRPR